MPSLTVTGPRNQVPELARVKILNAHGLQGTGVPFGLPHEQYATWKPSPEQFQATQVADRVQAAIWALPKHIRKAKDDLTVDISWELGDPPTFTVTPV
jgi:hypothetical protein